MNTFFVSVFNYLLHTYVRVSFKINEDSPPPFRMANWRHRKSRGWHLTMASGQTHIRTWVKQITMSNHVLRQMCLYPFLMARHLRRCSLLLAACHHVFLTLEQICSFADVMYSAPKTCVVFIKQTHQAGVTVWVSFVRVSARGASLLIAHAFKGRITQIIGDRLTEGDVIHWRSGYLQLLDLWGEFSTSEKEA